MQDPRFMASSQAQTVGMDAGLRSYMLGVYNHMTIGMAITGFFAYFISYRLCIYHFPSLQSN